MRRVVALCLGIGPMSTAGASTLYVAPIGELYHGQPAGFQVTGTSLHEKLRFQVREVSGQRLLVEQGVTDGLGNAQFFGMLETLDDTVVVQVDSRQGIFVEATFSIFDMPGAVTTAEASCILSGDATWAGVTGAEYCDDLGLVCHGVDYFGGSADCSGAAHSDCWGSDVASCCSYPMSQHAGTPAGASALWSCQTPDAIAQYDEGFADGALSVDTDSYFSDGWMTGYATCEEDFSVGTSDAAAACMYSDDAEWSTMTGVAYCDMFGQVCAGMDYYGSSSICDGTPYSACWGSDPLSCCSYAVSGHAGTPVGASAIWTCVDP